MRPFVLPARAARRRAVVLAGCLLAALLLVVPLRSDERKPSEQAPAKPAAAQGAVEVRFTDNSVLKLTLREEAITIVTPYGKLTVPVEDVQKIDFATRLPDDVARKVEAAVAKLGSADFQEREKAGAELLQLGPRAYQAVLAAAMSEDVEVRKRAEDLAAKIKEAAPPELLEVRKSDVLFTKDSKITGKIEGTALKATTFQFGEVQVKLADVRGLRAAGFAEPDKLTALADPGSLTGYASQFGKKLAFTVTGRADGSLWGTGVYTLDSTLAAAAVHAGVLKVGETGVVKVEIVVPPPAFAGTMQNGITSSPWNAYPDGAFQFFK
jgi:hypothetical protein